MDCRQRWAELDFVALSQCIETGRVTSLFDTGSFWGVCQQRLFRSSDRSSAAGLDYCSHVDVLMFRFVDEAREKAMLIPTPLSVMVYQKSWDEANRFCRKCRLGFCNPD